MLLCYCVTVLLLVGLFYIAYRGRIRLDIFRIVPGRFLEIEGGALCDALACSFLPFC